MSIRPAPAETPKTATCPRLTVGRPAIPESQRVAAHHQRRGRTLHVEGRAALARDRPPSPPGGLPPAAAARRRLDPDERSARRLTGRRRVHPVDVREGRRSPAGHRRGHRRFHDPSSRGVRTVAARVSRRFPRGRIATLGILGNHDYGPNWSHVELAQQVVDNLQPFGVTVLRNEAS